MFENGPQTKWAVEVLATLHEISQKLSFLLQVFETAAFQARETITPPPPEDILPEAVSVDEPVTLKSLSGADQVMAMSAVESINPKTARAIRIARALDEPFQAYIMNEKGEVGIIVGNGTKEHIERLRSAGQWA